MQETSNQPIRAARQQKDWIFLAKALTNKQASKQASKQTNQKQEVLQDPLVKESQPLIGRQT